MENTIRRIATLCLLALLIGLLAARLSAGVMPTADLVAQVVCADSGGDRHPKRLVIDQPVTASLAGEASDLRLLVGYDPEAGPTNFKGRIVSTATRISSDASTRRLGKVSSRQNTSDGSSIGEKAARGPLTPGDVVRWKIKLRGFQKLEPSQCVLLAVGFGPGENECGPYAALGGRRVRPPV